MANVAMPRLSDSMEEGTIIKWLKSDGDEVSLGDELVEIETDKANMVYESDVEGTLSIVAKEGDTLAVGDVIASIGGGEEPSGNGDRPAQASAGADEAADEDRDAREDEDAGEAEEPATAQPATATATAEADEQEQPAEGEASSNGDGEVRVKASPVARRMARELGVELGGLHGSGPGGRIVKADVQAAADGGATTAAPAAPATAPAPEPAAAPAPEPQRAVPPAVVSGDGGTGRGETTEQELNRLQQTIARRMAESKATAPEFVLTAEVDMEEAVALRAQLKAAAGDDPAPSYNDLVVKASALALRDFPRANGAYRDGKWELYSRINVGIAVAGDAALVVPTVFDVADKSLGAIAREARALAERVRAGAITPPELSAGTFTVSNLGMFGIRNFTAVINPPQAAILAVGEMTPRPVVRDGEIVVRNLMMLTLSCDHRILYGSDAAQFLGRIRERLERPLSLLL